MFLPAMMPPRYFDATGGRGGGGEGGGGGRGGGGEGGEGGGSGHDKLFLGRTFSPVSAGRIFVVLAHNAIGE